MNIPHMMGANSLVTFYLNSAKKQVNCKSWKVSRDAEKIADGVNGESRDRLDTATNFFVVSLDIWIPDAKILDAFIDAQQVDDDGVEPLPVDFSIVLRPRDGTKVGYRLDEGTIDDWSLESGGRTDRLMVTAPMRFRHFKKVPL